MPALKSPSSRPTASQKSQKSISSFFQPKSSPGSTSQLNPTASQSVTTASQAPAKTSQSAVIEHDQQSPIRNWDHDVGTAETSEGESDIVVHGGRSSSKRPSDFQASPNNEQEDQENSPPQAKRLKTLVNGKPKQSVLSRDSEEDTANRTSGPPTKVQPLAASERTSRYIFSDQHKDQASSPEPEEVTRQKQKLHQRFIKKLGRPDSIAEIKRRNHFIEDATGGDGDLEEEDDAEEEVQPKGKKLPNVKRGAKQLTPMEKQIIEIKRKNMDTVIVMEVGYKFRFFGEDARTAAKELSIVCIPGKFRFDEHPSEAHLDRFASASIPVHRLHFHVKRLVAAGHKVGVVRQLETAALKAAGDNRNAPFVRKLTNVYTKGTYIDDVEGLEEPVTGPSGGAPATGHLLCLTETNAKGWGTDEKVQVGLIAVQPATGDIIYDNFEDGFMRSEVETRLLHIAPCEFLLVGDLSKATEKLVQHLSGTKTNVFGDKARVERVDKPKTMAAQSYNHISNFYADKLKSDNEEGSTSAKILDKVHNLSENVVVCLSAMIKHLKEYGLEHVFDLTKNFQAFSARSHMLLNGNTLTSLEIYQNQTNHTEKGSLLWVLNQTKTRFGQRLLRKWVGRPLLDKEKLEERITAVEELRNGDSTASVEKLNVTLSKTKADLEKSLIRIYYGKCSRSELLNFLQTMQRIATEYAHVQSPSDTGFESLLLSDSITSLPKILENVIEYLEKIDAEAAKSNDKYTFFREEHETDAISAQKAGIASVQQDLTDYRKTAAEKLKKISVDYVTVAGIDYLIEVDNTQLKSVPASWAKISGTKKVSRFHAPEVVKYVRERDQHKETLAAACDEAFASLLADIATNYQLFRDCIQSLATLDCLMSLAEVASRPGYVKPTFTSDTQVKVSAGRHPMVEQLLLDSYVPNDIDLDGSKTRALLITGPNMGGKSSYVRQVALISIMGQIGSYVPATSAELGMLDAVFTRMGAFDNMMAGESTFMVELSETSDILKQATPRSLIILDELGRGTSTHDGVAIAHAVLDYIVRETRSLLLFITHYQSMSAVAKSFPANELKNMHMRFTESGEEVEDITFLYELGEGTAHRSYGLNVARLANVPDAVTEVAAVKSKELETNMQSSTLHNVSQSLWNLADGQVGDFDALVSRIEEL